MLNPDDDGGGRGGGGLTLRRRALMYSSYMNCEKIKNFFLRNWYVKLTCIRGHSTGSHGYT